MPKKPCKKDQIRNPDTGRCVKKTGRIGKAILDKKKAEAKKKKAKAKKSSKKKSCKSLRDAVAKHSAKVKEAKKMLVKAQSDLQRDQGKLEQCQRDLLKGEGNRKEWDKTEKWAKEKLLNDYMSTVMLKVKDGNGYYAYFEPANRGEQMWCTGRARGDDPFRDSSCTNEKTVYEDLIRMFSVTNTKDKKKIKALIEKSEKKMAESEKAMEAGEERFRLALYDEAEKLVEKAGVAAAESAGFKQFW